ncbi:hypothetical protein GOODEAATRI_018402 [Goodea atripinnis]|uniref:Uncharacterized protein n=1 Tax=Goodea atripinnis TaxID=208336 RepID=A0ABV0MT69_9TELE
MPDGPHAFSVFPSFKAYLYHRYFHLLLRKSKNYFIAPRYSEEAYAAKHGTMNLRLQITLSFHIVKAVCRDYRPCEHSDHVVGIADLKRRGLLLSLFTRWGFLLGVFSRAGLSVIILSTLFNPHSISGLFSVNV